MTNQTLASRMIEGCITQDGVEEKVYGALASEGR